MTPLGHSPQNLRGDVIAALEAFTERGMTHQGELQCKAYHGEQWRQVLAEARTSIVPRG